MVSVKNFQKIGILELNFCYSSIVSQDPRVNRPNCEDSSCGYSRESQDLIFFETIVFVSNETQYTERGSSKPSLSATRFGHELDVTNLKYSMYYVPVSRLPFQLNPQQFDSSNPLWETIVQDAKLTLGF